jgi:hypothetical protein
MLGCAAVHQLVFENAVHVREILMGTRGKFHGGHTTVSAADHGETDS